MSASPHKTYIIAEIGINHNGSLDNCRKLIQAAAEAGVDAVKFQTFSAKTLYPRSAGKLQWRDNEKHYEYDIFEAVEGFELPRHWIETLIASCSRANVDFISSVFDVDGLRFLVDHGMRIIKLSSYTITHLPLIEACARTGLPIVMSTGGATLAETEEAVNVVRRHHNRLVLLHCSLQYPTALEDCNLGVMETLGHAFPDVGIGYSDHTREISAAPVQAVYLGGGIIEKHITLGKDMEGPDHFFALEPHELKQMVDDIRKAERDTGRSVMKNPHLYGSSAKICHPHEKYLRDFSYSTLFARREIRKGDRIRPQDLAVLRPGRKKRGLSPKHVYLFEKYTIHATRDIAFEDSINWDSILTVSH